MAKIKKWKTATGDYASPKTDEILEWLVNNIADQAIFVLDSDLPIKDIMEAVNKEYGFGYLNPETFEESIRDSVQFPIL